jgi:PAS domain S-box-containing protein
MAERSKLNLLLVDDSEDYLFLTKSRLESEEPSLLVIISNSAEKALNDLKADDFDCIISDYEMSPGMNGMEFFQELRRRGVTVPFIFLTGQGNEELARDAFLGGVDDYFTKDVGFAYFSKLINAIKNAVRKSHTFRTLEYTKTFNKNIVNNLFEGFCVQDLDGRILMWSLHLEEISGVSSTKIIGKYIWDVFDNRDDNLQTVLQNVVETRKRHDVFLKFISVYSSKIENELPARIVPFQDEQNNILGSIILILDIARFLKK